MVVQAVLAAVAVLQLVQVAQMEVTVQAVVLGIMA
jgi:hypothetical protein